MSFKTAKGFYPTDVDFEPKGGPIDWPGGKDDESSEPSSACCEELLEHFKCEPKPTGWVITDGPLCGLPVYYIEKTDECVTFNPLTKDYEEIDTMANTIGTPAPADKGINCYWELVQASVCAVDAEVSLAPADILALVAGEAFNTAGEPVAVDITADDQELVWADVSGFPCDSKVKHADGDFIVTTAEACVQSVNGDMFNLAQGGNAVLGDSQVGDEAPIAIDETVVVPVGSAVRFCFKVKLTQPVA